MELATSHSHPARACTPTHLHTHAHTYTHTHAHTHTHTHNTYLQVQIPYMHSSTQRTGASGWCPTLWYLQSRAGCILNFASYCQYCCSGPLSPLQSTAVGLCTHGVTWCWNWGFRHLLCKGWYHYLNTLVQAYIHTKAYVQTCICKRGIQTCKHIYLHTYIHTYRHHPSTQIHTCLHTSHTYIHTYIHIHRHENMHTCMYT